MRPLRVVAVSKIFPNAVEPLSAPFNRQQFAALGRLCDLEVLATIPWYPGARFFRRWSAAGRLAEVPAEERIDGLSVHHPRFLFVPRIGHSYAWLLYALSLLAPLVRRRGRIDVLLVAWAYPDGAAMVAAGRLLGVPVVVKLHGSDMNVVAAMPGPRRALGRALPRAARVVAVSGALAEEARALGVRADRVSVVENGVDGELFYPRARAASRAALGLSMEGRLILCAGRLEREKGVLDLLDAFAQLAPAHPDLSLALVGEGSARLACCARARSFGPRVLVAGSRPLEEMPLWFGAADAVALPSWSEGVPNVLLEARAAGRPVVATRVGGISEVVDSPSLGELVPPRDPAALAAALARALGGVHRPEGPEEIAAGARGGWLGSATRLHAVLHAAWAEHRG